MSIMLVLAVLVRVQPPALALPAAHPAGRPPAVGVVGVAATSDSATRRLAPTPGLALSDLALTDRGIASVFSMSGPVTYPSDSLIANRRTRARDWLAQMADMDRGSAAVLNDPVLRGELEAAAGGDSAAQRTFATAAIRAVPGRRSYVLARAVSALVVPDQSDSALTRRLPRAERFLAQLMALPQGGYSSVYDSLVLVDRAYESAAAVLAASARLGDTARVAVDAATVLAAARRYTGSERIEPLQSRFPFEAVATVMLGKRDGRMALDSLMAAIVRIAGPDGRRAMREAFLRVATLGRPAPRLPAHAWLNTADSLYDPVPRAHRFDDGTIRILYFAAEWWRRGGGQYSQFPSLTRLHETIAPWGQVVIALHTDGRRSSDLVEAPEEVDWLRQLLRGTASVTSVVALWAAPKEPAPFDGRLPARAPLDSVYVTAREAAKVLIIDGRGIVRGLASLASRRDEERLRRAVEYLHHEMDGDVGTPRRPAILVPATERAR